MSYQTVVCGGLYLGLGAKTQMGLIIIIIIIFNSYGFRTNLHSASFFFFSFFFFLSNPSIFCIVGCLSPKDFDMS